MTKPSSHQKISVLMPAYNEGHHIYVNLHETAKAFEALGWPYEIVVISDGSDDETLHEARRAAKENRHIIVKHHRENYGKGRALKMGFRFTSGDLILFLDADLDLHPGQTNVLFDIMQLKESDVVIGSKRHPDSSLNYPWHRRFVSAVYFFIIKLMFGLKIRDTQTGIKLFKREVLAKVLPKILIKRFAYDLEILALAHYYGYQIAEAPVTLNFTRPMSRIQVQDIVNTWVDTMAVFYRLYILKYYQDVRENEPDSDDGTPSPGPSQTPSRTPRSKSNG